MTLSFCTFRAWSAESDEGSHCDDHAEGRRRWMP